ncbi:hypothetical protein EV05_1559 [Prochlorococcus sp. MIT 0601]|nr:hypothetical protein EV05_1559 [Prochlorococcus sp. MIT 0601]
MAINTFTKDDVRLEAMPQNAKGKANNINKKDIKPRINEGSSKLVIKGIVIIVKYVLILL